MKIITEEMQYRKRMCEYALKHGVTKAARKYHTNRKFVYRQLKKYDGTVKSLSLKSRRPKSHPNAHTVEEIKLLKRMKSRYGCDGLAEVYVQLLKREYKRSYGSMVKQLRKIPKEETIKKKKSYVKHEEVRGKYPGDKVQVDIKYVPMECLLFNTFGKRYYQITAIDEFSRKRILEIVDEKSITNTTIFIRKLEYRMGFKINTVQTDNGPEFVNNHEELEPTIFEKTLEFLNINYRRTRPYSPWQNGKVERSHKIDGERFYSRNEFKSVEDLKKKNKRYCSRYNNTAKKVLGFKSPNQVIEEYMSNLISWYLIFTKSVTYD